jgi:hypothetical protein
VLVSGLLSMAGYRLVEVPSIRLGNLACRRLGLASGVASAP